MMCCMLCLLYIPRMLLPLRAHSFIHRSLQASSRSGATTPPEACPFSSKTGCRRLRPSSGAAARAACARASATASTAAPASSTACAATRRVWRSGWLVMAGAVACLAVEQGCSSQQGCSTHVHLQAPEMVRVPLEELVLQIHLLRLGKAGAFLARVLQARRWGRACRVDCASAASRRSHRHPACARRLHPLDTAASTASLPPRSRPPRSRWWARSARCKKWERSRLQRS